MTRYVLVEDVTNKILKEVEGDTEFRGGKPPLLPYKSFAWYPLVIVNPPFDSATEVKEGPVNVFTSTEVTRTWTVRPKTAQELKVEKDERIAQALNAAEPLLSMLNTGAFVPGSSYTSTQLKTLFGKEV